MLFKCFNCGNLGFRPQRCPDCSASREGSSRRPRTHWTPIDPSLLEKLQFSPSGPFESFIPPVRRNAKEEWQETVDGILEKYGEFRDPYFLNFIHLSQSGAGRLPSTENHSEIDLLETVLRRLGFTELSDFNGLTQNLVRSTLVQERYQEFARRVEGHVSTELRSTLRSWIQERRTEFRQRLPMMLYYLWDEGHHQEEIEFSDDGPPLLTRSQVREIRSTCETVYFNVLVEQLRSTLEGFDPDEYVTIYDMDAMSGAQFEEFLEILFHARGFEVEGTQQTADQGADLFANRFGQKIVVQAKNYGGSVGNAAVQQAIAAREHYDCDQAMVVTNSRFTSSAESLADSSQVRLIDREALQGFLDDFNQYQMKQV